VHIGSCELAAMAVCRNSR